MQILCLRIFLVKNNYILLSNRVKSCTSCSSFIESMFNHDFEMLVIYNIRSSRPKVFCKKVVLKNLTVFTGKHQFSILSLNKVLSLQVASLGTKMIAQMFSSEFRKIFKNTYFVEHLQTTISVVLYIFLINNIF